MLSKAQKLKAAREHRQAMSEPRDWSIWYAYLSHVVQGTIAGTLAAIAVAIDNTPLSVLAALIVWQYLQYQHSSFLRKTDPVGRDIKDFGIGFACGVLGTFISYWTGG